MNTRRSLFVELRRRNVFRAATFYVATAWLLVEVVTQLTPVFEVPGWVVRLVVIAGAVGFPFAMMFSWLYEWTPDGLRRGSEVAASESITHLTGKQLDRWIIAVLLLAMLLLLLNKFVLRPRLEVLQDRTIAVLPLVNEAGGLDSQYFSDGISESLIATLSQLPGLKVISRHSSFQFRDSREDSRHIGDKLGAAHLLMGSVRREGVEIRIVVELVRSADGSTLWSQRYVRPYGELFTVQDDITRAVAAALEAKQPMAAGAVVQGDRPASGNLEAYNAYLQGRFYEARGSEEDCRKAVDYYRQATRLDPGYALGYAALSLASTKLAGRFLQADERQQAYRVARTAADTALSLQPTLDMAYMARGRLLIWADFDWAGGDAAYRRALQLAPNRPLVKAALADVEATLGHPDKAIVLVEDALAVDALNAQSWHSLATYQMSVGRLDAAELALHKAAELQPGMAGNQEQLAIAAILRKDPAAALQAAQREREGDWRDAALARVLQVAGDRERADAALRKMIDQQADKAAYQIAQVYALRGDADGVFAWLDRAWKERDAGVSLLLYDPLLSRFRGDPRFAAFCREIGLPGVDAANAPPDAR